MLVKCNSYPTVALSITDSKYYQYLRKLQLLSFQIIPQICLCLYHRYIDKIYKNLFILDLAQNYEKIISFESGVQLYIISKSPSPILKGLWVAMCLKIQEEQCNAKKPQGR